jgi:hypothetical protein
MAKPSAKSRSSVLDGAVVLEYPSVDEWILARLQERGAQRLDELAGSLSEVNWAQYFLAIDRLSRSGKISLWHADRGDYLISLKGTHAGPDFGLAS